MAKQILRATAPIPSRCQGEVDSDYQKRVGGYYKRLEDDLKLETNNEYHIVIVADPDINKTTVELLFPTKPILAVTSYMYEIEESETEEACKGRIEKEEAELIAKYKKLTNDEYHVIVHNWKHLPLEVLGGEGNIIHKKVIEENNSK